MKLSPTTIYIIGISFGITALSFGYFMHKQPNDEERVLFEDATVALNATAAKMPQAEQKVADAVALIKLKGAEWQNIAATRTPPNSVAAGGINLAVNSFQLTEDTRKYRNNVQRAVNAQIRRGGVEVVSGPFVTGPNENDAANGLLAGFYNYQTLGYPAVIFDLGTVTVRGTYNQIVNHIRAYKSMPRYLAVADGLRIDGTSPDLTATYNLTIVGFLNAPTIVATAPEGLTGGAPAGGAPAGGAPAGRPGPMGRPNMPGPASGGVQMGPKSG